MFAVLYFLCVLWCAIIFWNTKNTKCYTKHTKKLLYEFFAIIFRQLLNIFLKIREYSCNSWPKGKIIYPKKFC